MRKKISHLLAISLMLFASSCSKDDSSPDNPNNLDPTEKFDVSQLFGNWYEETMNEEMRINQNGTFYNRYSNVRRCAEIEGQWECNPQKEQLAFRYFFMGQVQESTWTIKSINQDAITVALDFGQFKYERIDHTFTLKPGETATINLSMANFTSQNSRIVSVTQDASGCILTAEGEKGTTYVKVNPVRDDPYYIKVIVSDDCPDLWWDYVSLIGLNQQETQKKLNALGSPITGDDGYSFGYSTGTLQDVIKEVDIFLCKEEEIVTEIGLALKESVPENTINTYLNAHYYEMVKNGSFSFYSTTKDPETSKAIIAYDKDNKAVWIFETEHFLHNPHNDILGNYYEDLGLTTKEIIEKYGNPASQNENILIYIVGTEYIDYAGFYIDIDTDKCILSSIFINENISALTIINHLNSKYTAFESGNASDGSKYAWINGKTLSESTLGIIYYPGDRMVSYQALNNSRARSSIMNNDSDLRIDLLESIAKFIK